MSFTETARYVLAPPHKAAWPFLIVSGALLAIGLIVSHFLAWLGLIFGLFCLYFFRDPDRVPPLDPLSVIAPADGRVVIVDRAAPPAELGLGPDPMPRVCIFLSVLDVHVNRMPLTGTVSRIVYRHGAFLNASLDKASEENERNALALTLADGRQAAVVQIAGLIARRILCDVREGAAVEAGQRFGIIRFGSRTDLYLPEGTDILTRVGQTMLGGETVLARLTPALPAPAVPVLPV